MIANRTKQRRRPRSAAIIVTIGGLTSLYSARSPAQTDLMDAPAETAEPAPAPPPAAPPTRRVVPPKAITALEAAYPVGASGDASVLMEVVVGVDGAPAQLRVVHGEEPFAAAALHAAQSWRFEPARRGDTPVAARIRVQVVFTEPPPPEPEPEPATPPTPGAPAEAPSAAPPPQPAPEPIEVVVSAPKSEAPQRFTRAEVRQLPGAFGDPFRAIEVMPGVTPIASGLPYFFVRGAPPGNVGYFFDNIPVPTLYHAAVGPAVIHPAFIETVSLYPGGYPARYGRFAGGIVAGDGAAAEYRFRGEASVRLVDSGAMLEVPFAENRGSLLAAGRYSYTGAVVSLLVPEVEVGYWDYQARAEYRLSSRDTISAFGFGSFDFLRAEDGFGVKQTIYDVTFHRLDLRYDRSLAPGSSLRVASTLSLDQTLAGEDEGLRARTRGARLRAELDRRLGDDVRLRGGADFAYSRFDILFRDDDEDDDEPDPQQPGVVTPVPPLPGLPPRQAEEEEPGPETEERLRALFDPRDDLVTGAWAELVLRVAPRITVTPGLRFDVYNLARDPQLAVEPRVTARFQVSERVALLHAFGIARQPPSFPVPIPGVASSGETGLQTALQSSSGTEIELPLGLIGSVTAFQNVLLDGTDAFSVLQIGSADDGVEETDRVTAHSYGLEFYLRRSLSRRLGGFLSYTLSRSQRMLGRLSAPSSFDRTHVLNLALAYDLGHRWRAGGRFTYYSGIPAEVAYPAAIQDPPRTPPFWRLDWRLEKRWLIGNAGAWWALVFEVLNTTLNKEVLDRSCYAYGCQEERIGPVTVPSIGVEAAF